MNIYLYMWFLKMMDFQVTQLNPPMTGKTFNMVPQLSETLKQFPRAPFQTTLSGIVAKMSISNTKGTTHLPTALGRVTRWMQTANLLFYFHLRWGHTVAKGGNLRETIAFRFSKLGCKHLILFCQARYMIWKSQHSTFC